MRATAGLAVVITLLAGGCSSKCPIPVTYDEATLKAIQAALEKLPRDSILLRVMQDYEMERDDLRFCR